MDKRSLALTILPLLTVLFTGPSVAADIRYAIPEEGSASIGPKSAPVTIAEFVDYQ